MTAFTDALKGAKTGTTTKTAAPAPTAFEAALAKQAPKVPVAKNPKAQADLIAHPELHYGNPLVDKKYQDPAKQVPDFPIENPITSALKPKNILKATTQVLPGATQAVKDIIADPWSVKRDAYTNLLPDMWKAIKDPIKEEAANIKALIDLKKPMSNSEAVGTGAKAIAGVGKILFSPISALFAGANDIPVLGTVSKLITVPFAAAGDAGAGAAKEIINKLPISQKAKEQISPGIEEIFALGAQIALGKTGWDSKIMDRTKVELTKRFGANDAETIVNKAVELANEKKAREFPQENPIPKPIQAEGFITKPVPGGPTPEQAGFVTKPVKGTPKLEVPKEFKPIIEEAKTFNIDIGKKPSLETIGTKIDALKKALDKNPKSTLKKLGIETSGDPTSANFLPDQQAYIKGRLELIREKATQIKQAIREPLKVTDQPIVGEPIVNTEVKSPTESTTTPKPGTKVPEAVVPSETTRKSKVGASIEAKAIEKGLTESFGDTAEYTPITIKDQAERAAKLIIEDVQKAKDVALGHEPLPDGLRAGTILKAMEDYAMRNNDVELLRGLANSPLTSETSLHAQELRILAERNPDSATVRIREIAKAREEAALRKTGTKDVATAKKKIAGEIKAEIAKTHTKETWSQFVESIKC